MKLKKSQSEDAPVAALNISKLNGVDNRGFSYNESVIISPNHNGNIHSNGVTNNSNSNGVNSNNSSSNGINHRNGPISIISGTTATDNSIITPLPSIIDRNGSAFPDTDKLYYKGHPIKPTYIRQPKDYINTNGDTETPSKSQQPQTPKGDDVQLKQSLNLWYCTAMMVAVTGHASIFISPSQIIEAAGSIGSALIMWLAGGLINMGTAMCFAELGTMYPEAGGPYNLTKKSFGPLIGFLLLWGYALLISAPFWAFLSYTAALYIVRPIFPDCLSDDVITATKLLAGWIMVSMVVLNCLFMKYVKRFQTLLSSCKIFALLILIGSGVYNLVHGKQDNFEDIFEGTTEEPGKMALACFYSIFSYGGWQVMTTMLEEMKKPERDAPVSIYISFAIVITKYVTTNVAYATLMTPSDIHNSPAVALDFMDRMYSPLVAVIAVLVAFTCIGALNASIMGHSRLLYGGARSGQLPQILGMLHIKYLTPWPSIFVFTVLALIMLFSGGLTDLIGFMSLFSSIMNLTVVLCLLYLRYTKPDQHRPYKPWIAIPITVVIIFAAVLVLAIYQKPHKMGIGLAILFAGIPVYLFGHYWKRNEDSDFVRTIDNLTANAQKLLMISKTKQS